MDSNRRALNRDFKERDRIITGSDDPPDMMGGIYHFEKMELDTLLTLMRLGYADPKDAQNDSPTIEEFIDLMHRHAGLTAHGYAVSLERDDYRFSVEGIAGVVQHTEGLLDVLKLCRQADEFEVESDYSVGFKVRAWWD